MVFAAQLQEDGEDLCSLPCSCVCRSRSVCHPADRVSLFSSRCIWVRCYYTAFAGSDGRITYLFIDPLLDAGSMSPFQCPTAAAGCH